ncbi:vWA domain-containing protein [Bifidobacterium tissieri]|uniref:VWA domain-containing protein n=1 Tax=Bifidobacterium tissieri TaxID=1630162 RepID=A0A5M9ZKX5_9BIFI|nr:VWA domain-containing protein [Bifidobacterium tissieri]KAA8828240.1 VWA domain-containing protein [Bifidobacterium tissieri]KAA8828751.1 VWA domain-containing protein [Bifidobacterium tissieri]
MLKTRMAPVVALVIAMAMLLTGCAGGNNDSNTNGQSNSSVNVDGYSTDPTSGDVKTQEFKPKSGSPTATLKIASGSENREVAGAIQKAVDDSKVAVTLDYMGSLDIMNTLSNGGGDYDAVWPASSMWISMGDTKHIVKNAQSTSTTPIVFGIEKKTAQSLGWADNDGKTKAVATTDLIDAVKAGQLKFSMTSATQSNSGASAYLAFLTAIAKTGQALTKDDLNNANVQNSVKTLLSGVDRSSGSSDWLKDMVVANPDRFDAMVNYESLVIQANKQLTKNGKDPLVAIYPADGIAVSDSPLGYVDRGQKNDTAFGDFSKALQSKEAKLLFEQAGRRTGLGGVLTYASDAKVKDSFRSEWGINTTSEALKTIPMPAADVINASLDIYQSILRKPSWTVWVVDYSGSMTGTGKDGVVKGLNAALNPDQAKQAHIESGNEDVNVFIPFSSDAFSPTKTTGTDTSAILNKGSDTMPTGGTDIYAGLQAALQNNMPDDFSKYTTAIVLMTDGQSQTSNKDAFTADYKSNGHEVPIFSIMFGEADPSQLQELASLSNAKVFDGRSEDLATVFRQVKGYN